MASHPKFINHWETLGLDPTIDRRLIEWAYKLACHHNNSSRNERQASIETAWKVLGNAENLATYCVENCSHLARLIAPLPPPHSFGPYKQPAPYSTGLSPGGGGPSLGCSAGPASVSGSSKRTAEEEHPVQSKRPRMPVTSASNIDNIVEQVELRAIFVESIVRSLEDMGYHKSDCEAVKRALLRSGSGAGLLAVNVQNVLQHQRQKVASVRSTPEVRME